MTKVSDVTVKSWKTFTELLSSVGGLEVLARNPSEDVIYRIQASILSGGTDSGENWSSSVTYNTGDVVIFSGAFWESLQDNNLNNPPVEGSFWTKVEVSTANGFGRYATGLYTVDPTVVINGDSFYVLSESVTLPFNSTDFNTELAQGKWVQAGGNTFDTIRFNSEFTPSITQEGEIYWNNRHYTPEFDTGLGKTVTIGNNKYVVFYNNTGAQIDAGICLHLLGGDVVGGEIYPTFEIADPRNYEKIQGTLTVSMHDIPSGQLGLCALFAQKITGVDTASIPAGSQLWISADGTGRLTNVKPEFPNWSISVGGNYTQSANGEIFVNFTKDFGDIYHESWDGSVLQTFDFIVSSDGINVTGTLSNVDPTSDLTLNYSDGPFTLDTTTVPLTVSLTPGTDSLHETNYVYIPKSTKVLTVSSAGFPETEHVKIATLEVQSAASVQTDGGAYGNQNINDHIKREDNNGHILHITERLRQLNAQWDNGSEAILDNTGGNGYLVITAGQTWQLHKQDVPALNMALGDIALIKNDFTTAYRRTSNLASITAYSDGSAWNNEWSKIVVWRVANKTGEPSFTFVNIPSDGYNSEANAISDALNYADYSIPDKYKGVGFLVASFAVRVSGGVITYNGGSAYDDLRGFIPNNVAGGGGGGGGGVTSYLALTDTPSSYSGKSGNVPIVNSAESGQEFEPKGWFFNIARTFKAIFNVESLTADRTYTFPNKDGTFALLDDIGGATPEWDLNASSAWDGTSYSPDLAISDVDQRTVNNLVTTLTFANPSNVSTTKGRKKYVVIDNSANTSAISVINFGANYIFPTGTRPSGMAAGEIATFELFNNLGTTIRSNWSRDE